MRVSRRVSRLVSICGCVADLLRQLGRPSRLRAPNRVVSLPAGNFAGGSGRAWLTRGTTIFACRMSTLGVGLVWLSVSSKHLVLTHCSSISIGLIETAAGFDLDDAIPLLNPTDGSVAVEHQIGVSLSMGIRD